MRQHSWACAVGDGAVTHGASLNHLLQRQVHPGVAHDQMAVERLAILELDEHGVALGRVEQAERQLEACEVSVVARMIGVAGVDRACRGGRIMN